MKAFGVAGVMLAGFLAAGCARGPGNPQRAAAAPCTQVSVSAMEQHVTLTSLPAACKGLTRAQLMLAANAATSAVTGTRHGKTLMRARRRELSPLLPHLAAGPRQRSQPVPAAMPSRAGGLSPGLTALAAWLITVGLGAAMMARWIARGGLRHLAGSTGRSRAAMNFAHLGFAVAGLVTWIGHLVTGVPGLAWAACVFLLPVAGLGMSLLLLRLPEGSPAAAVPAVPAGTARPAVPAVALAAGPPQAPAAAGPPPARQPPALVVAAHIAFAVATILFTFLATVGSG
jgi:hypothetical protein